VPASSTRSSPRASKPKPWPPQLLTPVTPAEVKRGDGPIVCDFVDAFGRVVKDSVGGRSGEQLLLRPWQRSLLGATLARRADGRLRHRRALIGMPRKNGKSGFASELGKALLFLGPGGGEVYSCAADKDQARITFAGAKRGIEMEPDLLDRVKLYRDAIEVPETGSVWRVLSAEAFTKEGLNPHAVIFDEVHAQPNDELWNVMALAMGARRDPIIIGITTAGVRTDSLGQDTLCNRLYQHGRQVASGEVVDPAFFFAWWEPKAGADADHTDPAVWLECNPGLHPDGGLPPLVDLEDFVASLPSTPESEFRTKRTNVFVTSQDTAIPHGAWDRNSDPTRVVTPDESIVLMVDGSWRGDCTGIVSATIETRPHLSVEGLWEAPQDDMHWRVPVTDVEQAIRDICRSRPVRAVAFDPYRWQQTMAHLEDEGIPIIEFPTGSLARMVPAWKTFYDAVVDGGLTHSGDPRLARHIENMKLNIDRHGARPVKESKMSKRHIDLGICAVGALVEALIPDVVPSAARFVEL
jgi:phage terminase large subunit-like protein